MTEHKATPEQWGHVEEYGISLVERVAAAITEACPNYGDASPQEARAAIRVIAVWLYSGTDVIHGPHCARLLEDELKKPS